MGRWWMEVKGLNLSRNLGQFNLVKSSFCDLRSWSAPCKERRQILTSHSLCWHSRKESWTCCFWKQLCRGWRGKDWRESKVYSDHQHNQHILVRYRLTLALSYPWPFMRGSVPWQVSWQRWICNLADRYRPQRSRQPAAGEHVVYKHQDEIWLCTRWAILSISPSLSRPLHCWCKRVKTRLWFT